MAEPPAGYARIEGSSRAVVPGARRVGPAEPTQPLSVSIRLRRRPDAPPLPDPARVATAAGAIMTREQFAATYGADPADIARVEAFAREHGLTVGETSIARRTVVLEGTVAQMSEAFKVELSHYQAEETSYRGREGHVHIPDELAPLVEGVFGLDNRRQARPLFRRAAEPAQATQALTPPQVAQLYNFPAGLSAAGETIGLLEFGGGFNPADITAWFKNLGLAAPPLTTVDVDGATNSPGSDADTEVILDIDVAGSAAPDAEIAVYFAPWTEQGWVDVVTTAVHDATNHPSVLSISWGWPEFQEADGLTWTAAAIATVSATFAEAAVLGVTVLAASGDQGSDCQIGDGHAHVLYPTSDPGVTSCGGTTIENVAGASFGEVLWNDNGASGGGISDNFPVPFWQLEAGLPVSVNDHRHQGRGVPDVAGNADPASGYNLIQNGAQLGPIGGTSATAPLYAGLIALINANLGFPVGYLNPVMYTRAQSWGVFRDITTSGTNAYNHAPGYPVGAGWDATTGLGAIDGTELLAALIVSPDTVSLSADLTGDGQADIVGFGDAGVYVSLNSGDGTFPQPTLAVGNFGYEAGGWRVERHPRSLADLTGDHKADIVGFGDAGVWVALNQGNGTFQDPVYVLANFGYDAGGWRVERHPRFLADLTGDGQSDIVGFGDAGVYVSLNHGDGTFPQPTLAVANFGYDAGGWRVEDHPRYLADLTGDGRADIVGFGNAGVYVSLNHGDGTFSEPTLAVANFGYDAGGWRVEDHPRFLADVTGDGKPDIVGFGNAGVYVSLNNGNGTFQNPELVLANFGYEAGGWRVERHPRYLADLSGDGRADIVGFGDAGVYVSLNNGHGAFPQPTLAVANFGYEAGGWNEARHPRFLADLTGDGQADIVGFGDAGVWTALNHGKGAFPQPLLVLANFGYDAGGWRVERHPRFVAGPGSIGSCPGGAG
jgi:Pro-kumamolisin, activation domain/FG-GAP-like repeat